jgi:catechol 2,3-dioxygenase-like lactoylglutathione lyase family enzyme
MPASPVTIDEIVIADPPSAWRDAGFTVDPDGTSRVGQVRLRFVGRDAGKRIVSWSLRGVAEAARGPIDAGSVDGLATSASTAAIAPAATHPNGVTSIDHLVLATPDQQRSIAAIEALGLPAKRTRHTDTYGAPFLQTFFRAGEVILELIGPESPSGDGPAGFFGLAFNVEDLDATCAFLGEGVGASKDAVQPGRRIATMRHKHFGMSVAVALMTPGADAPQ